LVDTLTYFDADGTVLFVCIASVILEIYAYFTLFH